MSGLNLKLERSTSIATGWLDAGAATSQGQSASRTAVLVCQGRAAAHGRLAPGRFADPVAETLLRDDERGVVDQVRDGVPPTGWSARTAYETVRACAEIVVPRTVAIDDAIRAHQHEQLVVLGAGLDTRAWRLAELVDVDVTEVDHPASQRDKRERLGDRPSLARTLRFAAVDFEVDDLESLTAATDVLPHANQIRWFVGNTQPETTAYCKERGILVEGYSPLATGRLLDNEDIAAIAEKYGKSVAQVSIRYLLQKDILPLPKSTTPSRIAENADVDFELSAEDIATLDALDAGDR